MELTPAPHPDASRRPTARPRGRCWSPAAILASALALALGLALALAGTAAGQTTLAQPAGPSKVASYAGVTAFSEIDPATGRYRLMFDTNSDGDAEPVPVGQRIVPFDVDLGPGRDGHVLATYSKCRQEPRTDLRSGGPMPVWTTGRGCDVYLYDFREQRETRVPGASTGQASEMLPSVWRGEIAFVRVYERREGRRGVYPYLYVRAMRAGATSRRQPGGARGASGVPGPMALDLVGPRLGFSWTYERDGGGVSEIRLVTVDRSHRKIDGEGWDKSLLRYVTPHVADGRLYYGEQRSIPGPSGPNSGSLASWLWRYRISSGELARADAPPQLFAAVYDRRSFVYVLGVTAAFFETARCGAPCRIFRLAEGPTFDVQRVVAAPERDCGTVVYTPQSDHGAFGISAEGVSCRTARAIARYAEGRPTPFTTRGYRCEGERREDVALPTTRVTCVSGDRSVVFDRS